MRIRNIVGSGRPLVPAELLPTETVVHDPQGRFAFQIPWPWFRWADELTPGPPPRRQDRIVLFAPRTTQPWPEVSAWSTVERLDFDDRVLKSESRRLAQSLGGKPLHPRRLEVAGAPAAELVIKCDDTVTHKVDIVGREAAATVIFRLPLSAAAGYAAHMETMLATWEWT